jgi:hypothetical protein
VDVGARLMDDIDQVLAWALGDEPVVAVVPSPAWLSLSEYSDETLITKIHLVRTMVDAAWSHPATYDEAARLSNVLSDLMREAGRRHIKDDIDRVIDEATSGPQTVEEPAPVPQPLTMPKPPQDKRWRCMVTGCNPILDEETAQQHRLGTGHRVAKWPVRSAEGKRRARKRNRTGYYRPYNEAAAYADAVVAGRFRDGSIVEDYDGFDNTEHQNHDF